MQAQVFNSYSLTISVHNIEWEVNFSMAWKFKLVGLLLAAMALTTSALGVVVVKRLIW
jgi:hypothetical protein